MFHVFGTIVTPRLDIHGCSSLAPQRHSSAPVAHQNPKRRVCSAGASIGVMLDDANWR
jgi:hypothetical protein